MTHHRAFTVPLVTHHRVAHCGGTKGILLAKAAANEKRALNTIFANKLHLPPHAWEKHSLPFFFACYLAFGILSFRPPRGVHPPESGPSHTPQSQCPAALPSHADTDHSDKPASLTRPTVAKFMAKAFLAHARGLTAHFPRGPAQPALRVWGSGRVPRGRRLSSPRARGRPHSRQ